MTGSFRAGSRVTGRRIRASWCRFCSSQSIPNWRGGSRQGDIVLAGRNFACGKPRLQGLIAMASLDLAVVCISMPYKMLRRTVARAIPVIADGPGPHELAMPGDEIEIDFASGAVWNLTRDIRTAVPQMPPTLRDIVACGGTQAMLRHWLERHPEQGLQRTRAA
jgi:3-isopropylmalate/(R)-2-methylmalate dehydratase small subunit